MTAGPGETGDGASLSAGGMAGETAGDIADDIAGDIAGVVLAAGLGTRLRPLTTLVPKALCPVDNVPLVDLALERLRRVTGSVAVNVHAGREQMEQHLQGRAHLSIEIDRPLGTAGGLARLRDWIDGRPVLVTNADAWHRFDLGRLVDGWDGERERLLVVHAPARPDFGPWRYTGAALLPWSDVARLHEEPSGLYEVLWRDLERESRLDLVPVDGPFIDCGTPRDYLLANLAASGGKSVVHPTAVVEGTLERSVVWAGAVVTAGEHLVDCIRAPHGITVDARE